MRIATFTPQAWINDCAVEVDAEGPRTWPLDDDELPDNPEPDTYQSDAARFSRHAPAWVREWSGPFYCSITEAEQ